MDLTPYSTVKNLMGPLDSWLSPDDAERLAAYSTYEAMYRNVPETFKLVQRGNESNPIYLPSAKTIIEAKNRYLAKRWTFALDPLLGTPEERLVLNAFLTNLFQREEVWTKFATQKRFGLIRGDQVWHVVADEKKEPGKKLSIYEIDPASYFPIDDPWNADKIYGVHLVDPVENAAGKTVIKRQTYRKDPASGRISYELSWWETGAWDDRQLLLDANYKLKKITGDEIPEGPENDPVSFQLDPRITAIPVYHIKNNRTTGAPFGTSELSGLESLIAGINQTITDEHLALALEGLGLYFTNSGPPVDEEGKEINWKLGPGWVVEGDADSDFKRVSGVSNVDPSQTHMTKLEQSMRESSGVPDIAVGKVDVQVAESGIALAFQMGPILAGNEEKEVEILSVTDHLLYDIVTMWLPVYEGITTQARANSIVDDPLPLNRKATLDEIIAMVTNGLISIAYAQTLLSEKLGYNFPTEMLSDIVNESAALAAARNVDPFAARVAKELDDASQ